MRFLVLGCSGGIGGEDARTTSFLVDDDILVDCGTGVGDLSLAALERIDHVFITHAHLDHVAFLPLLADSVLEMRSAPITVYALAQTIAALREHIFNGVMWPDFTTIPTPRSPVLNLCAIHVGQALQFGSRTITALPAFHSVPALAYCLDSGKGKLVFSGDTAFEPEFVAAVNRLDELRHFVIETAFADEQSALARASSHLYPEALFRLLDEVVASPEVHVSHLKPGLGERVIAQVGRYSGRHRPRMLRRGDVLQF